MTSTDTAQHVRAMLADRLHSFATVAPENGTTFTVRGWPFAILRNGSDAWDILHPGGMLEAVPVEHLAASVAGFVADAEADNAGWDFDPPDVLKPEASA